MAAFDRPRFWADAMLGGLARWLRVLGYDTRYEPYICDQALVQRARAEARIVLTRDRALARALSPEEVLWIAHLRPLEQLQEVVARFALDTRSGLFSRCLRCNAALEPASWSAHRHRLPSGPRIRTEPVLYRCPCCDRLYWEGGHVARMRRLLGV
ncbi:MAG: Mut7-C RNAse domain-containing protein [Bacteroidetes bacterium]|nr:Mut7-C RNAse domain-containing protein [Bacteroidota bacterium]